MLSKVFEGVIGGRRGGGGREEEEEDTGGEIGMSK